MFTYVFSPSSHTCASDNVAYNFLRSTSLYPSPRKSFTSEIFDELSGESSGLILSLEALMEALSASDRASSHEELDAEFVTSLSARGIFFAFLAYLCTPVKGFPFRFLLYTVFFFPPGILDKNFADIKLESRSHSISTVENTPAFNPTPPPTSYTSCKGSYSFHLKILRKF